MMLLAKAYVMFLDRWESNELDKSQLREDLLREKIPVILFDVLLKILDGQEEDGSWSQQCEPTAYAILAFATLRRLPWLQSFSQETQYRVNRGRAYLLSSQGHWRDGAPIWIEKVTYSSSNLSLAYCLAATKAAENADSAILGPEIGSLLLSSPATVQAFQRFFSKVLTFSNTPALQLELWILQAAQFSPRLGGAGLDFNIPKTASDTRYLAYIPFTWISICNGTKRMSMSSQWEMMVCSVLNYQIDDFMEFAVALKHGKNIGYLKSLVRRLCTSEGLVGFSDVKETKSPQKRKLDETHKESGPLAAGELTPPELDTDRPLGSVEDTLAQYIKHFLQHPKVLESPPWMQTWLAQQLQRCLIAHLQHLQDCANHARSSAASGKGHHAPKPWTYFDWVHSTAADNTTANFSFAFFLCLIFGERGDRLLGGGQGTMPSYFPRYVAEDMCQHLAAMCRQQNDYGSAARDRAEGVLNGLDFDELSLDAGDGYGPPTPAGRKKVLLQVSEYERGCVENALTELGKWLDREMLDAIRVFVDVTDLYGQMYILKDRGPGT